MIKKIINFLDYAIFFVLMIYLFCGGLKYTIDILANMAIQ